MIIHEATLKKQFSRTGGTDRLISAQNSRRGIPDYQLPNNRLLPLPYMDEGEGHGSLIKDFPLHGIGMS